MESDSQVVLTNKIREWGRIVLNSQLLSRVERNQLETSLLVNTTEMKESDIIPFRMVKTIYECLKEQDISLYLHELLEDSDVYFPPYIPPPRNPQLELRIDQLKAEQSKKNYQEMTKNVNFHQHFGDDACKSVSEEIRAMNKHLITMINFSLTILAAAMFGYNCPEFLVNEPTIQTKLIFGMIFATLVFIADLYFIVRSEI